MVRARKPNRTDLAGDTAPTLPATAVPGQPYGEAGEQLAAQEAVPMGTPPTPRVSPRPSPAPGSLPYLDATQRPHEPVTAGINYGPGPGPEALGTPPPTVADRLTQAARQAPSEELSSLALAAHALGL